MIVIPNLLEASFFKSCTRLSDVDVSSPVVGSSKNKIDGLDNNCIAKLTLLCSPPDNVVACSEKLQTLVFFKCDKSNTSMM